jgi:hypothetical protein
VTRREHRELLGWSDKQVRSATERLVRLEHLVSTPGGRGRLRRYRLVESFAASGPERSSPPAPRRDGSPSVRPSPGRTSYASSAGRTSEFARFASSPRTHDAAEDDVDVDVDVEPPGQLSFPLPVSATRAATRRGARR